MLGVREPRYLVIFARHIDTQRSTRRALLIERRLGRFEFGMFDRRALHELFHSCLGGFSTTC
ncbi:hypothetical protein [Paraburkholderia panacisoli]|uniref:hypothetical protein n=1 Tax=Paraburkholderia panacisoli TaxID=2603818 RepID=UPI001FEC7C68|nr:hypothetical protein [Paraburkholderia panacisoli]